MKKYYKAQPWNWNKEARLIFNAESPDPVDPVNEGVEAGTETVESTEDLTSNPESGVQAKAAEIEGDLGDVSAKIDELNTLVSSLDPQNVMENAPTVEGVIAFLKGKLKPEQQAKVDGLIATFGALKVRANPTALQQNTDKVDATQSADPEQTTGETVGEEINFSAETTVSEVEFTSIEQKLEGMADQDLKTNLSDIRKHRDTIGTQLSSQRMARAKVAAEKGDTSVLDANIQKLEAEVRATNEVLESAKKQRKKPTTRGEDIDRTIEDLKDQMSDPSASGMDKLGAMIGYAAALYAKFELTTSGQLDDPIDNKEGYPGGAGPDGLMKEVNAKGYETVKTEAEAGKKKADEALAANKKKVTDLTEGISNLEKSINDTEGSESGESKDNLPQMRADLAKMKEELATAQAQTKELEASAKKWGEKVASIVKLKTDTEASIVETNEGFDTLRTGLAGQDNELAKSLLAGLEGVKVELDENLQPKVIPEGALEKMSALLKENGIDVAIDQADIQGSMAKIMEAVNTKLGIASNTPDGSGNNPDSQNNNSDNSPESKEVQQRSDIIRLARAFESETGNTIGLGIEDGDSAIDIAGKLINALQNERFQDALGLELDGGILEATDTFGSYGGDHDLISENWENALLDDPARAISLFKRIDTSVLDSTSKKAVKSIQSKLG